MNDDSKSYKTPVGNISAEEIRSEIENLKENKPQDPDSKQQTKPRPEPKSEQTSTTTAKNACDETPFEEMLEDAEIFVEEDFAQAEAILVCATALGLLSLLTPGNLSLIAGKPKSGKTTLLAILIAATYKKFGNLNGQLNAERNKIIYIDCESGSRRTQNLAKLVCRLLNVDTLPTNIRFYSLRKYDCATRLNIIEFLAYQHRDIAALYLDGYRDLIMSINDFFEVGKLMERLLRMIETTNVHLSGVLHFNKSDRNTRGVLGSEMNNKAELVIAVDKKIVNGETTFVVKPELSREMEFPAFAFRRVEDSLEMIEEWKSSTKRSGFSLEDMTDDQHNSVLGEVFAQTTEFSYKEIVDVVQSVGTTQFGSFSEARAKKLVSMYYDQKRLQTRKDGMRTMYRLAR